MRNILIVISALLFLFVITSCGESINTTGDPRQAVINFFGAMQDNDTTAVAHYLDFKALMSQTGADYALSTTDEPRSFKTPQEIILDLVDGGLTKGRWFSMQRVVGDAEQNLDSALVEVSFIDKRTDKQYFTKFGLRKINEAWKIYSFKTLTR
ncbi:MAG: hypothetical protein KAR42_06680 [candidate division Zixibacteria bacterium]|nr:hypothetical protein [candidate division Zixibacteria bacterium]